MSDIALIKTLSLGYILGLVTLTIAAVIWRSVRMRLAPAARADVGFLLIVSVFALTGLLALAIWAGVVSEVIYMSTPHFHALMHGGWGNSITGAGIGVLAASLLIAWLGWLRGRTPRLNGGEHRVHSGLTVVRHAAVTTAGLIGCWRPQVWINPAWWAELSPLEQEMALEHERCHLHRRDNLRKLLLQAIASLYALLPFTSSWVKQYELDCELAVDDTCRRRFGERGYSALIARSASYALSRPGVLSSGMSQADLKVRLKTLQSPAPPYSPRRALGLALALALGAIMLPTALLGHELSRCMLACYLGY